MNELKTLLNQALHDSKLSAVAAKAILLLDTLPGASVEHSKNIPSSSLEFAKIYELRRSMNYFSGEVSGLDETIDLLSSFDRKVSLISMQINQAIIAMWIEESSNKICGLLVFKIKM
jgi:hypothetical protein